MTSEIRSRSAGGSGRLDVDELVNSLTKAL